MTQNNMQFKMCFIGETLYDEESCRLNGNGRLYAAATQTPEEPQVTEFMRNLALNNSIMPMQADDGSIFYRAASLDELALVNAATLAGIHLLSRDSDQLFLLVSSHTERFYVLQELEFTSERKRMSVVILNEQTQQLRLYTKGADEALKSRLSPSQPNIFETFEQIDRFARNGYRTLVFAYRDLSAEEFRAWQEQFAIANRAIVDRAAKKAAAFELLEHDLILQGCTAIEDKLADQIPQTIRTLREAGIKFFMITGDTGSTALNIANSCSLKAPDGPRSHTVSIQGETSQQVRESIRNCILQYARHPPLSDSLDSYGSKQQQQSSSLWHRLLVYAELRTDAPHYDSSREALRDDVGELTVLLTGSVLAVTGSSERVLLTQLLLAATTVICCRMTPAQKSELTCLVRSAGKMTLAIGDGSNDVAMILQANCGVGIRGKEGLQAARAADFVVNQFKALAPLLLVHGQYSYVRSCLVAQYSFYKSFFFCFLQIAFGFVSSWSGSSLFNSLCVTAYNAVLFFPIVSFILTKHVPLSTALNNPKLYSQCVQSKFFNAQTLACWLLRALYQGLVLFLFLIYTYDDHYHLANQGGGSDYDTLGISAFTSFLWIQSFTMSLELHNLTHISLYSIWGFHLFAFLLLIVTTVSFRFDSLNGYWIALIALNDPILWLNNLLVTVTALAPVLALQYEQSNYRPTLTDQMRYVANYTEEGRQAEKWDRETPEDAKVWYIQYQHEQQLQTIPAAPSTSTATQLRVPTYGPTTASLGALEESPSLRPLNPVAGSSSLSSSACISIGSSLRFNSNPIAHFNQDANFGSSAFHSQSPNISTYNSLKVTGNTIQIISPAGNGYGNQQQIQLPLHFYQQPQRQHTHQQQHQQAANPPAQVPLPPRRGDLSRKPPDVAQVTQILERLTQKERENRTALDAIDFAQLQSTELTAVKQPYRPQQQQHFASADPLPPQLLHPLSIDQQLPLRDFTHDKAIPSGSEANVQY